MFTWFSGSDYKKKPDRALISKNIKSNFEKYDKNFDLNLMYFLQVEHIADGNPARASLLQQLETTFNEFTKNVDINTLSTISVNYSYDKFLNNSKELITKELDDIRSNKSTSIKERGNDLIDIISRHDSYAKYIYQIDRLICERDNTNNKEQLNLLNTDIKPVYKYEEELKRQTECYKNFAASLVTDKNNEIYNIGNIKRVNEYHKRVRRANNCYQYFVTNRLTLRLNELVSITSLSIVKGNIMQNKKVLNNVIINKIYKYQKEKELLCIRKKSELNEKVGTLINIFKSTKINHVTEERVNDRYNELRHVTSELSSDSLISDLNKQFQDIINNKLFNTLVQERIKDRYNELNEVKIFSCIKAKRDELARQNKRFRSKSDIVTHTQPIPIDFRQKILEIYNQDSNNTLAHSL